MKGINNLIKISIVIAIYFLLIFILFYFPINSNNKIDNEINSPNIRIQPEDLAVTKQGIILKKNNVIMTQFADTNSMDPLFDSGAIGIEIKPLSEQEIKLGDIISYNSLIINATIIHRVIEINNDENGNYYTVKGDNNLFKDKEKIRFNQIKGVLVGIFY